MSGNQSPKAVVLYDNSITQELRDWLDTNGKSEGGRRLLRLGYMLEKSGLADQIMLLAAHPSMVGATQFDLVKKSVQIMDQLSTIAPKPQPEATSTPLKIEPQTTGLGSVFKAGKV